MITGSLNSPPKKKKPQAWSYGKQDEEMLKYVYSGQAEIDARNKQVVDKFGKNKNRFLLRTF